MKTAIPRHIYFKFEFKFNMILNPHPGYPHRPINVHQSSVSFVRDKLSRNLMATAIQKDYFRWGPHCPLQRIPTHDPTVQIILQFKSRNPFISPLRKQPYKPFTIIKSSSCPPSFPFNIIFGIRTLICQFRISACSCHCVVVDGE